MRSETVCAHRRLSVIAHAPIFGLGRRGSAARADALSPRSARAALLGLLVAALLGSLAAPVQAQITAGTVRGVVTDADNARPIPGAQVVIDGPSLQQAVVVETGVAGDYEITGLPPGTYSLSISLGALEAVRPNVLVLLGKVVRVDIAIDTATATGELIEITGAPPLIDQGSTKTGVTITEDYTRNIPVGRNFDDVLELAPGAQADAFGTSFGGATSPENSYIIEGLDVTGIGFGLAELSLPIEFVREVEIISGGYGAEYGRATGGIANVVLKSGSNDWHGSVFSYFTPGQLAGETTLLPDESTAIVFRRDLGYSLDLGADISGPIIPDKLWFYAGVSPSLASVDADRVITGFRDRDGDGRFDRDPSGALAYEQLDSRTIAVPVRAYNFAGNLTFAAAPGHNGHLAVFGNPGTNDLIFDEFAVGPDNTLLFEEERGALAAVARWGSRFFDGAGQLDARLGIYRARDIQTPKLDGGEVRSFRFQETRPLADFSMFEPIPDGCTSGRFECPVTNYQVGGVDVYTQDESQRIMADVSYRHIVEAAGRHRFKVGADVAQNRFDSQVQFSGGERWWNFPGFAPARFRFIQPGEGGAVPCGADVDGDGVPDGSCVAGPGGREATAETLTTGLYVQDSWTVLSNLTVNAGLRYERQAIGAADEVAGLVDPFSGEVVPDQAVAFNNLSPRAGVIYDWTNQGRSRLFGHVGRYYESIPMDLNARGFSGETFDITFFDPSTCGDPFVPESYGCDAGGALGGLQLGGSKLVAPGLKGQHVDEFMAGVEYEPVPNLKVGATYVRHELGRAVEDVSPDGGATFILANPGEIDADEIAATRAQADAAEAAGDMAEAARLDNLAQVYEGVGRFDKPRRTYDALELSLTRRFSQRFMARASYTYARLRGNFPGLFSPDTGQLDPNFTSMYDLPELMVNRDGSLPAERPRQVKLDAYYKLPLAAIGTFTVGSRVRAVSGRVRNHLGGNLAYGEGESFLLPRGSGGRNPLTTTFDAHLAYSRAITEDIGLELFVAVFNLFNQQATLRTDEIYTFETADPIAGGDLEDLDHLKSNLDPSSGQTVSRNPNYQNPVAVQNPVRVRFGLRLVF